jgi:N6-adenosine-specific RNA methylase IME4
LIAYKKKRNIGIVKARKCANINQFVSAPRRMHSQKPDIIRKHITDLYGGESIRQLELFARILPDSQYFEGWDVYGSKEAGHTVDNRPDQDKVPKKRKLGDNSSSSSSSSSSIINSNN